MDLAAEAATPVDETARWLDWAWHVLATVLIVAGTIRATSIDSSVVPWVMAALLIGLVVFGIVSGAWPDFASAHNRRVAWWLWAVAVAILGVGCATTLYPDAFIWLVFPVGLVVFHRVSLRRALLAGTGLVVFSLLVLSRADPLTGPRVLGPVIGLAVAAAGAIAIKTLQAEAARRWLLVVELRQTRDVVAKHEHQAGITEERARLARDIHDTVAQGLSSILMLSSAIQRQWGDVPPQIARYLSQLDEVAREDLSATRRLIADLAPSDLEHLDLAQALRRSGDRVQDRAGVVVDFALSELPELSRDVEVAVLRIVGQAMDNAVRHGRPSRIRISADTVDERLVVDVHDDGTGFDPDDAPSGRGIAGMRARVDALSGRLTIESHIDGGTVVAVELPIGKTVVDADARTDSRTDARTDPRTEKATS